MATHITHCLFPVGDPRGVSREDFVQGLYGMPELMALVKRTPVSTASLHKLLPLQQQLQLEEKLKPRYISLNHTNEDDGSDKSDHESTASMTEVSSLDVLKHLPGQRLQWRTVEKIISSGKNRAMHSADSNAAATATQLGIPDKYYRNRNPPSTTVYILQQCVALPTLRNDENVEGEDEFDDDSDGSTNEQFRSTRCYYIC